MTDWFRSWHGAPTDPKWLGIARKAGVAPGIAVAVAWALMDRASQAAERGSIEGYDADGLACFFGCEPEQVEAIVSAMNDKGMVAEGRLTSWDRRQPKREDDASERTRQWRERKKTQGDAVVTRGDAPDTETEKIQNKKESKSSEPNGSAAKAPPADFDPRKFLFDEGLPLLAKACDRQPASLRGQIGKWLKATGDDAERVTRLIAETVRDNRADPVAWIERSLKPADPDEAIYRGVM